MCATCSMPREPAQAGGAAGWAWWVAAQAAYHSGNLAAVSIRVPAHLPLPCLGSEEGLTIGVSARSQSDGQM